LVSVKVKRQFGCTTKKRNAEKVRKKSIPYKERISNGLIAVNTPRLYFLEFGVCGRKLYRLRLLGFWGTAWAGIFMLNNIDWSQLPRHA